MITPATVIYVRTVLAALGVWGARVGPACIKTHRYYRTF